MIAGIGIDIAEISRIKSIIQSEHGKRFLDRVFTEKEKKYCYSFKNPFERFAGRFAAKEAFIKASSAFISGIALNKIEVVNNPDKKPYIVADEGKFDASKFVCHLSISHTDAYACAFVVIEHKEGA